MFLFSLNLTYHEASSSIPEPSCHGYQPKCAVHKVGHKRREKCTDDWSVLWKVMKLIFEYWHLFLPKTRFHLNWSHFHNRSGKLTSGFRRFCWNYWLICCDLEAQLDSQSQIQFNIFSCDIKTFNTQHQVQRSCYIVPKVKGQNFPFNSTIFASLLGWAAVWIWTWSGIHQKSGFS